LVSMAMLAAQQVTSVGCGTSVTLWLTAICCVDTPPLEELLLDELDELDELEPSTGCHCWFVSSHHHCPSSEYWTSLICISLPSGEPHDERLSPAAAAPSRQE
jgi:hypothetical protein